MLDLEDNYPQHLAQALFLLVFLLCFSVVGSNLWIACTPNLGTGLAVVF